MKKMGGIIIARFQLLSLIQVTFTEYLPCARANTKFWDPEKEKTQFLFLKTIIVTHIFIFIRSTESLIQAKHYNLQIRTLYLN